LFSYLATTWRPGFPRRFVDLDGMFRFGVHIMVHNFAVYFSRNFDAILIGKFLGTYSLGLYDRAYKVLLFPIENLAQPISRVMVPMLARGRGDRDEFSKIFILANSLLHIACLPALAALIGSSDQFILVFLGKSFSDVAPIFFWLGFAGFVQPLIIASHWVLLSEGRSHTLMMMSLTSALFVSLCLLIGLIWGLMGVAIAYVCGEVFFRVPMMIWTVGRASIISYAVFFRNVTPIVASTIFTFLFTHFSNDIVSGLGLVFLNLVVAYFLGLLFLAVFPHGRAFLREVRLFLEIWFSERVR
jgi:PST family polysaccharide transporter